MYYWHLNTKTQVNVLSMCLHFYNAKWTEYDYLGPNISPRLVYQIETQF